MWEFILIGVSFILFMLFCFAGSYVGFPLFLIGLTFGFFILLIPFLGVPFIVSLLGYLIVLGFSMLFAPIAFSPFAGLGGFMAIISLVVLGLGFFGMFGVPLLTQLALPTFITFAPLAAIGGGGPIGAIVLMGLFFGSSFLFI